MIHPLYVSSAVSEALGSFHMDIVLIFPVGSNSP